MNYRHAFHAGNFADVFKHAVLARILVYLSRKDAPFRFIDTHAGAGRYDLSSLEGTRSPEWRDGVARVLTARPGAEIAGLLEPLSFRRSDRTAPTAAPRRIPVRRRSRQALMRAQDRIALCEANPEERAELVAALGRDSRLSIVGTDGYVALNAYLPPKERRGLVLIDPPFEAPDEAERVVKALAGAVRKWPAGVYAAWRPIRDSVSDARFLNAVTAFSAPNILRLELDVGPGPIGAHGQQPLARAGLIVVNPPHTLIDDARILLPWLAKLLARDGRGAHLCGWLTPPK